MTPADLAFANNARAVVEQRAPRTLRLLVRASAVFFVLALAWSSWAVLDEVARGEGRVVPSRQLQVVQSAEGGVVRQMLVREGQVVQAGQSLLRMDDSAIGTQLAELGARSVTLRARLVRLEREVGTESGGAPVYPAEFTQANPQLVAAETSLFSARARKLAQDVELLDLQVGQRTRERDELAVRARTLAATKPLLERELTITRRLASERSIPESELMRVELQIAENAGQNELNKAALITAEAAIAEVTARRDAVVSGFRASAEEELAKTRAEIATLDDSLRAAQERLRRAEPRSPVRGVVNRIHLAAIGATVAPGATLVDLMPLDDTLLLEAQLRPQDIGHIRPDQEALVRITAYDSAVFGSLKGKVERVGTEAGADRVIVRTEEVFLGTETNALPVIPGMAGTVEVITGRKSVLSYLLKPVRLIREGALKER